MKDRQRWQPEEDALLRAYVKQYGPKEWSLISHRMGRTLDRDPKSCLERWKNYLKPGLKKGSLTAEEQALVISLQARHGNKWKKIAAELPGRTPKRLGKWWEVFKEKQQKLQSQRNKSKHLPCNNASSSSITTTQLPPDGNIPVAGVGSPEKAVQGPYDHILETFAEKYVVPVLQPAMLPEPDPVLSLGSNGSTTTLATVTSVLPPWMNMNPSSTTSSSSSTRTTTPSPSVSFTDPCHDPDPTRFQHLGALFQLCKEVEEGRQSWMQHRKEASWRLSRLEQQLDAEKARKRRQTVEEIEVKIRCLREEEMNFMGSIEKDYNEGLSSWRREAERKESELVEAWCAGHLKLAKLVQQIAVGVHHHHHTSSTHGFIYH